MTSAGFSFLLACGLSLFLTPLVRRLAQRTGLVEGHDGELKLHSGSIPRLGGVAVAAAFFAPLAAIFALGTGLSTVLQEDAARFAAFCLGALAIFLLGLWDDVFGARASVKFVVEAMVAVGMWQAGFRVDAITLPWGGTLELGPLGLLVTVVWIVGITNALNLVDGLDGLAAGVAFFAAGAHVVIAVMHGDAILALFASALAGAALGFLPYNFHPARIFLGDSGSLFLGHVLAVSAIYGATHKSSTAVAVLGPILVLGLPILDTALAMLRRTLQRRPIFDGDREHVHHRLLDLGLSQRRSVWLLYGLCAAFALAGLVATAAAHQATALALVSLLVVLGVFERRLGLLRRARRSPANGSAGPAEVLATLSRELEHHTDIEGAWTALAARAPDLQVYRLRLTEAPDRAPLREWLRPGLVGRPREGFARHVVDVAPAGHRAVTLEVEMKPVRRGVPEADRLFGLALRHVLAAWARSVPGATGMAAAAGATDAHPRG